MRESLARYGMFIISLTAFLLCHPVMAAAPVAVPDVRLSSLSLLPYTEIFVEKNDSMATSLEELVAADQSGHSFFTWFEDHNFSFGYTPKVHWFRWTLQPDANTEGEWWLQISPTFLDSVDLYIPQANGEHRHLRMGDHVRPANRPMLARHFLAPLDLSSDSGGTYYLRVQTSSTLTLGLTLWDPQAYAYTLTFENMLYGLLFGLILAAMVVSLISGLWMRKTFYFAITAFLFFNGMMHFCINGYDQIFYNQNGNWPDRILACGIFASGAAGVSMSMVFIQPRHFFPRFSMMMWGIAIFSALGAVVSLLGAPMPSVAAVGGIVVLVSVLTLTLIMLKHRFVPSLLMLLLFGPGLVTLSFQMARNFSLLPMNFWTTHVWALMTILQVPYIALVVMLHLRAQEKAFLSEQQKAKLHRDLFSMVAHELRTPLAVVGSAITNIQLQTQDSHPELAPRFQRTHLGLARINALIDNALAEDRLLSRDLPLQLQTVSLKRMIEQVEDLRPVEAPHFLRLDLPEEDIYLDVDPQWFGHALINLLDNAIKYSPGGGLVVIKAECHPQYCEIQVIDQGIGIPDRETDRIFEKFYRANNALKMEGTNGMGLGLFIVHTVVSRHEGQLQYRANPAGGAIFTIILPRKNGV